MIDLEGLEILPEEECRHLLRQASLGRVGVSVGALPVVLPVNYIMAGEEVLFFTAEGTKLRAATANAVVAFEVDQYNALARTGWSVLVVGMAREREDPAVVNGAIAAGLRPWVGGDRSRLVAVSTEVVSGRRILPPADAGSPGESTVVVGPSSRVGALAHTPVRVGADWTLGQTALALRAANVSSAMVGNDEAIVTERDLTRALTAGLGPDAGVASVCVTDFVSIDQATTVVDAAGAMLDYDVRHLVVHNHRGATVGLVSLRDLVRVLVDAMDPAIWVVLSQRLAVHAAIPIE
jgi:CBS domain-containing protein